MSVKRELEKKLNKKRRREESIKYNSITQIATETRGNLQYFLLNHFKTLK